MLSASNTSKGFNVYFIHIIDILRKEMYLLKHTIPWLRQDSSLS